MKKFTKHPITASSNYPKVPAGWSIIPEGNDEDGNWTTLSKTLPNDEGYIWLDMQYDDDDKRYYELSIAFRMKNGNVGPIMSVGSNKKFYRLGDAVKYAEQYCNRVTSSCNVVNSNYDHRYSAEGGNMKRYIKSAKQDPEQYNASWIFLSSIEPEKVKLVQDCRNTLLSLYSETEDYDNPISSRKSEILRDYKSEAAEDWEDCTVDEADELFDDILSALDDIYRDEAAAWI